MRSVGIGSSRRDKTIPERRICAPTLGWVKGFEPSTPGTTIRCSNQLSYTHHMLTDTEWHFPPAPRGRTQRSGSSSDKEERPCIVQFSRIPPARKRNGALPFRRWHARRDSNPWPTA